MSSLFFILCESLELAVFDVDELLCWLRTSSYIRDSRGLCPRTPVTSARPGHSSDVLGNIKQRSVY